MNRILNNLEKTLLNKGIVIFILGLIALWIVGYILIDYFTAAEWQRYKLQLLFSRITLVTALFIVFLGSYNLLKQFLFNFSRTASDLAIFRILYFGFFAVGIFLNPNKISDLVLPFLEMPTSAQVAIPFMSWYPKIIPINLTIVSLMTVLFYTSIFTSLIGFKTRWSILIFTITLTYLFFIPNLYGKINHNHHLVWFPAILAFSPCADRFSLDHYFRKRNHKLVEHSSEAYSLPFLLIWILFGLIYFFPGFWKMWSCGLDWCFTDNIRNQMYRSWDSIGGWLPYFRIDKHPFLYKASGMYTLIFELFFIPLLINHKSRKLAIILGIGFHFGTLLFMNIFFIVLIWSYFSFVPWNKIPFLTEKKSNSFGESLAPSNPWIMWVGIPLISLNIIFGFGKWNSWPFTVYPTFDYLTPVETERLVYRGIKSNGKKIKLSVDPLYDKLTTQRYTNIESTIINVSRNQTTKTDTIILNHLLDIILEENKDIDFIEVSIEKRSMIPEKREAGKNEIVIFFQKVNTNR